MMRVLLVSGSLPPLKCGVGDYTDHLALALASEGLTVCVLTSRDGGTAVPYEVLRPVPSWGFADLVGIVAAIRRWKPDLVHIQLPTQAYGRHRAPYFLGAIVRAAGIPVVQTWHEYVGRFMAGFAVAALAGGAVIMVRPRSVDRPWPMLSRLERTIQFRFIPGAAAIPTFELDSADRDAVRTRYAPGRQLIVYFGFVYPAKSVEQLFEIVDDTKQHLVLACDLDPEEPFQRSILERSAGHATVTGFLPPQELGRLLAAADAVVLPFRDGGGTWNSSLHAASRQGTFVLTTSRERRGYDAASNIYFAVPGDIAEMRVALAQHAGKRGEPDYSDPWQRVAREHVNLYRQIAPEAFG
jgi:glycosyltransferase involved in cell wall biosynthesis